MKSENVCVSTQTKCVVCYIYKKREQKNKKRKDLKYGIEKKFESNPANFETFFHENKTEKS